LKLNVIGVKRESHSAKESGQRPVFKELLEEIRKGIYDGILTWAPDRLSRNAGDLGSVVDLMDQHKLIHIQTYGQTFSNSPNEKFLLMILCSQAKLENDNKSINVKRGLRARVEMGLWPCRPPTGYTKFKRMDQKCESVLDPVRAPVIKQMFEKVAYEQWSGRKIYMWLRNEMSFKTETNKYLSLGNIYRIFENHFYYGRFEFPKNSGNWYFDGLRFGTNLTITCMGHEDKIFEIKCTYNGYCVFEEIEGNIKSYAPFPEWRNKLEDFYLLSSQREMTKKKLNKTSKIENNQKKMNGIIQKLKLLWNY
jgi:DNA invertase Pin-like site-specific DNA recombinase